MHVEERAALAGIPDDVLETARAAAEKDGRPGWKFVLHIPSYLPVMQYAENRSLREIMYRGSVTRASEAFAAAFQAKAEFEQRTNGKAPAEPPPAPEAIAAWDNTPLIARILALRQEAAQLLGYATFAEVSLVPKMAEHPQQVLDFLEDLAARARPYGERDWAELGAFAAAELGLERVEAWDIAFASERLRQARYAFSDQEVKQYFPEPKVLAGMFRLVETLYGIRIEEDQAETWDPTRALLPHHRRCRRARRPVLPRPLRARDEARRRVDGRGDDPPPHAGRAAAAGRLPRLQLLGPGGRQAGAPHPRRRAHALPRVRARPAPSADQGRVARRVGDPRRRMGRGRAAEPVHGELLLGVGRRAPHVGARRHRRAAAARALRQDARGEELPVAACRRCASSSTRSSTCTCTRTSTRRAATSPLALLDEVRRKVAVSIPPAYNRFPNTFSHIFAGGYSAGYYSYKWAEVLSADAYSLFEEKGVLDAATGARFRDEILAVGGSRPAIESFRAFRGREPTVEALLRHNGMTDAPAAPA